MHDDKQFRRHRFGVNYTPSRRWYFCWNDWHPDEIARDLDAIAAIGADHLRVMLIWPYFQPNLTYVSPAHLDRMEVLLQLAAARNLEVLLCVFTGQLSGWYFRPPFENLGSMYTQHEMVHAEKLFLTQLVARAGAHRNLMGFDLGNELNTFAQTDVEKGDAWMREMFAHLEREAPAAVRVNGVDHQPWFRRATFSPRALVADQEIVPLHCWTKYTGALERGGSFDPPAIQLQAAMTALARSFGNDPQKPVWIQEYGCTKEWLPTAEHVSFLEKATVNGIEGGASWFTWWASHDLDPQFTFNPVEYDMGLLTADGKPKDTAHAFRRLAEAWRGREVSIPARPIPPPPVQGEDDPGPVWNWLRAWMKESAG